MLRVIMMLALFFVGCGDVDDPQRSGSIFSEEQNNNNKPVSMEEPICELSCTNGWTGLDRDQDGCPEECVIENEPPEAQCGAVPSCLYGHWEITDQSECVVGGVCYTDTLCGGTVLCTG